MFDGTVLWCDPFFGMEGSIMGRIRHGCARHQSNNTAIASVPSEGLQALSRDIQCDDKPIKMPQTGNAMPAIA
ncbi:MAG: hypothetical protein ABJP79_02955 [Tateyamaria sp.]|uniref:hypothetical protein n=1 Tax=Tateyamaria sp. TaxID=1929288 RepID=UPI00329C2B87